MSAGNRVVRCPDCGAEATDGLLRLWYEHYGVDGMRRLFHVQGCTWRGAILRTAPAVATTDAAQLSLFAGDEGRPTRDALREP